VRRASACAVTQRAVATDHDSVISSTTAKLIAAEALAKAKRSMPGTPSSWLAGLDGRAHARRYGQTLCYLQTCYEQALQVLPPHLNARKLELLRQLVERLTEYCSTHQEQVNTLLGEKTDHLKSVPKYYYSELRYRMDCLLPAPPNVLSEEDSLRFLGVEAVACLRSAERFGLLAAGRVEDVPAEAWKSLGDDARKAGLDIFATMVVVFGEARSEATFDRCVDEERAVYSDMMDGSTGRVRFGSGPPVAETALGDEDEDDEDDEGDGDYCSVVSKPIFIVSDCTGESAERTVQCSLGQFGHCFDRSCPADTTTFRFCTRGMIEEIVKQAKARKAFIVFTLVDPLANQKMVECCQEHDVENHDLWSPLLEKLEGYLDTTRQGVPGRRQFADEEYMQLVECIEYTRTLDDGVQPHRWKEADIMILGPSRSGKTPLAFFMAQRGYKVANYPLVPGEDIPKELWEFDQSRVFALDIDAQKLTGIRNNRMKTLRMGSKTSYAALNKVKDELNWCKNLYRKNSGWTVLDTSDSGIEETSARILLALDQGRGVQSRVRLSDNPSAI